jgi:hypothetical protein
MRNNILFTGYGQPSYGQQQKIIPQSTYGSQVTLPMQVSPQLDQQQGLFISFVYFFMRNHLLFPGYGQQQRIIPQSTYGSQLVLPQQFQQPKHVQLHHTQMNIPKDVSYGTQITIPQQLDQPQSIQSYGTQMPVPQQFNQPQQMPSYGAQFLIPQQRKFIQPIVQQHDDTVSVTQSSGY